MGNSMNTTRSGFDTSSNFGGQVDVGLTAQQQQVRQITYQTYNIITTGNYGESAKGSSIKDVRKKMTPFHTPLLPVRKCPHLTNPPLCGRPHLASYTALWSDSVIAGAVKITCSLISSGHFTPTPCGLICGSCN